MHQIWNPYTQEWEWVEFGDPGFNEELVELTDSIIYSSPHTDDAGAGGSTMHPPKGRTVISYDYDY